MKSFSHHCDNRVFASLLAAGLLCLSAQLALAVLPATSQDSFTSQSSSQPGQTASDIGGGSSTTSTFIPTSMLDSPPINQSRPGIQAQPVSTGTGSYQNNSFPGVLQNVTPSDSSAGFGGQAGFAGQAGFGNPAANSDAQNKDGKSSGSIFDPQNEKPMYGELTSATRKKDGEDSEAQSGEPESSAPAMDFSSDSTPSSSKNSTSPLGIAVRQVKLGHLPDALKSINKLLQSDSENANAHYLKAVVLVLDRNFADARTEYGATLKYSHSEELNNRARIGLSKLSH